MMTSTTQERLDAAARQAHDYLATGEQAAHRMVDSAAPALSRVTAGAEDLARRGKQWLHDSNDRVRTEVARASDRTVGYVRDEPVRSMLAAAAAGALLYALVRMLGSHRAGH